MKIKILRTSHIKKAIFLGALLFCLAHITYAEESNAGYVQALGIVKGNDNKNYIKIKHSIHGGEFNAGAARLMQEAHIEFEGDAAGAAAYATLQKAFFDHSLNVIACGGYTTTKINGSWNVVLTCFYVQRP